LEDLIALVSVVSKQKVRQIEIISEEVKLSKKTKEFYEGIRTGLIKSDLDAVQILYNQFYVDSKYRKLKGRLRNRLLNTVFFIDVQKFGKSDEETATVRSYHLLAIMKILKSRTKRKTAMNLADEALKVSLKFDIVDLIILLTKELKAHYGVFEYNKKKYAYYADLHKKFLYIFSYEIRASNMYITLAQKILKFNKSEITQNSIDELRELEITLTKISSFKYNFDTYNSLYFYYYLIKDYQKLVEISGKAVSFFQSKPGFLKIGIFDFLQKQGVAKYILGDLIEAIKVYEEALNMNPREGGTAWFNIRNHLFNAHLKCKEYDIAYKYLLESLSISKFKNLYESFKEQWLIKEAYMQLLIKMGKIEEDKDSKNKLRPFRINRFLNEVPLYSRDKSGRNIAILIIHVLFLFIQKKDDELQRRLDALGQYSFRYLRNDETLRSNAFIKMLQKLPDANYHPKGIERRVDKFYKRLVETPMNISEDSAETEVIPYEHLWEIVLELLQMRVNKEI